jgi:serine/threonine protein kinase
MGEGTFGTVAKAIDNKNGEHVAIKCLLNTFDTSYHTRTALREVILLRKLTELKNNIYTTKLIDIIFPDGVIKPKIKTVDKS